MVRVVVSVALPLVLAAAALCVVAMPTDHRAAVNRFRERFLMAGTRAERVQARALLGASQLLQTLEAATEASRVSWWGDESSIRRLSDAELQLQAEADEEFELFGTTPNDIDLTRFRSFRTHLSVEHQTALAKRIAIQRRHQSTARRTYHEFGLNTHVATKDAVCTRVVGFLLARGQAAAGGVHMDFASSVLDAAAHVPAYAAGDLSQQLFEVIVHRINIHGWAIASVPAICNANALEKGVRALRAWSGGHPRATNTVALGLEEEFCDVEMTPDNPASDVTAMVKSADIGIRDQPFLKLSPDHKIAPAGYPTRSMPVIEVATGPLDMHWSTRDYHRQVVTTLHAQLAAPLAAGDNNVGAAQTIRGFVTAYNAAIPAIPGPAAPALVGVPRLLSQSRLTTFRPIIPPAGSALWAQPAVAPTHPPNPALPHGNWPLQVQRRNNAANCPVNSVQVNFECSLCAVAESDEFLDMFEGSPRALLLATRATAHDMLTTATGAERIPGITLAMFNALPAQQRCELKGLFTTFFGHAFFWAIRNRADSEAPTHATYDANANRRLLLDADPIQNPTPPIYWGGHWKNAFSVQIKNSIDKIVKVLPFPAADAVAEFVRTFSAGAAARQAAATLLAARFVVFLTAQHDAKLTELVGPIRIFPPPLHPPAPVPWLTPNGGWIDEHLNTFRRLAVEGATGSSSPIGGRTPESFLYTQPVTGSRMVMVVAEARYQTAALNRAFTHQMMAAPAALNWAQWRTFVAATETSRVEFAKTRLELLKRVAEYKPIGASAAAAVPIVTPPVPALPPPPVPVPVLAVAGHAVAGGRGGR